MLELTHTHARENKTNVNKERSLDGGYGNLKGADTVGDWWEPVDVGRGTRGTTTTPEISTTNPGLSSLTLEQHVAVSNLGQVRSLYLAPVYSAV